MFARGKKRQDSRDEFSLKLLEFYKNFLQRTAETVKDLYALQKDYKEYYDEFVEFQKDPGESLMELTKNTNSEAGAIVFFLLARIAILQSRMTHVFELNADQQEKLSKDLGNFITEFDTNIEKLKKLQEGQ